MRKLKKGIRYGVGGTLVVGGALTATFHNISGDRIFHSETAQEQKIADAYTAVYDPSLLPAKVVCKATVEAMGDVAWPTSLSENTRGFSFPLSHTVWLDQTTCNTLADLPNKDVFSQTEALRIAAHEGAHGFLNTGSEEAAECYAFQRVEALGKVLGQSARDNENIRHNVITHENEEHHGTLNVTQPLPGNYGFDLALCHDGGSQDLDPGKGEFPTVR